MSERSASVRDLAATSIRRHRECVDALAEDLVPLQRACDAVVACLDAGGKILACGNGGSAADAQHFVAEIVGRFERERRGLPAVALSVDPSVVTAIGNDFGFDLVFARQVEALARPGDLLLVISTSGRSPNVIAAAEVARRLRVAVIALVGREAASLEGADVVISVPSEATARVQETHILVLHLICEIVDRWAVERERTLEG